ncbi:CpsD/CapB family tyrosine-protein kinase [Halorubellus sp. JP-L1]|uniref:CpsD/CapB family tyrosine-protein kinase n=1 Tax=Halorubellus sp. JP-L1 TaxID=2715753 RepID=UPI00140CB2BB|nr:CpsD/CapB family tyrosine-protein kinase [Halorubellus sp. JP-L1]NHN41781.1 CpsD/CapB family tyrosine-protein kinase [Halorubellus sp. JP-L1]
MSTPQAVAVAGVTGGAGTTRLAVETAAVLARAGRDVAVFDAAFGTQGLAQYVPGRVDVDATALLADDAVAPSDGFVDLPVDADGRVAACPARAPFAALAAAKTPAAAERFADVLRESASAFDHVIVDTPPVADNPSVAAVAAADRTALVAPATQRGADALPRLRDRLADVDAATGGDLVVANQAPDAHPVDADVDVPASDATAVADAPVCDGTATGAFPAAVRDLAEVAFTVDLDLDLEPTGVVARFRDV